MKRKDFALHIQKIMYIARNLRKIPKDTVLLCYYHRGQEYVEWNGEQGIPSFTPSEMRVEDYVEVHRPFQVGINILKEENMRKDDEILRRFKGVVILEDEGHGTIQKEVHL